MKLYEYSFRDLFHQFILLPFDKDDVNFAKIAAAFPHYEDANALLLYGFIDHEGALLFEVLSTAYYTEEKGTLFPGDSEISAKIHAGAIREKEIFILNRPGPTVYNDKVGLINISYKANKGLADCRRILELDPHRHPDYPDRVAVVFYDQEKEPEYCWVRCEGCRPPHIIGTLLDEPKIMTGIHRNEKVAFNLFELKKGLLVPTFLR